MEILKSNQKLKDSTLQDFIESKKEKPTTVSFQTPADKSATNYDWMEKQSIIKQLESDSEKKAWYNNQIRDLDPLYTALNPLDGYIIRMFVRENITTSSGLLIKPEEKVQSVRPGSHTPGDLITNPYEFSSLAVIVCTPDYEQRLKPGMVVQVIRPKAEVLGQEVVGYEFGYAHPDYLLPELPKSPTDRHYGYCLVPYQRIKVIINE